MPSIGHHGVDFVKLLQDNLSWFLQDRKGFGVVMFDYLDDRLLEKKSLNVIVRSAYENWQAATTPDFVNLHVLDRLDAFVYSCSWPATYDR